MKRFMLAAAALFAGADPAVAQEEPAGSWAAETSAYYFARGGSATDGTYLYLFGGYQLGVSASYPSYYRRSRRYDPATDTWTTLANLPIAATDITYQYNAGACVGGRLYSFGTSYQGGNGIVLSYSIADDAWTVLDGVTLPGSRSAAAATVLGGLVYVAGGFSNGPSRRVDAFDPSTNTFTQVADLPDGRHLHAMAAVPSRGSLFVIGGMSADGYEATCFEYSPSSDAWTERAPITIDGVIRTRGYLAAFTLRNRIYATGGRSESGTSSAVFEYYPANDAWSQRASMGAARYQHAAIAIGGRGYVYGGLPVYSEGEEFTPPDFGPAPELESPVAQVGLQPEASLQAGEDPSARAGWMGRAVEFTATISDPDPGDLVRLRNRSRRPQEPLWTELDSGLVAQGTVSINYTLPTKSDYDWEYRIEDAAGNSIPSDLESWLPAFGNSISPDLRSDRTPPTIPAGLYPRDFDVPVADPEGGDVIFGWQRATDDGPEAGLVHEIEIGSDPEGAEPGIELERSADEETASVFLPVSSELRWWRVRARDIAGHVSAWSPAFRFRVVYDDRINHSAGDARKGCGFGPGPGRAPGVLAILAALAAGAGSILNSRRRGGSGRPQNSGLAPAVR